MPLSLHSLLVLSALFAVQAFRPPPGYEGCKNISIGDDNRGEDTYALINEGRIYQAESLPLIYIEDSCAASLILQQGLLNKHGSPRSSKVGQSSPTVPTDDNHVLVRMEVTVCSRGNVAPAHVLPLQNYVFSPVIAICNNGTCGGCGRLWVHTKQFCSYAMIK